ncbi:MAG TPA: calcium-binding protein, partial [Tepidisphaeraceae bacterium]|nr:calcium-binding protein [Tepidisphaeraceae bacterium]
MNLEVLEMRRLFAVADGTAALNLSGVVEAAGTTGDDVIVVQNISLATRVTINGVDFDFPSGDVNSIQMTTGDGNDSITISNGTASYVNSGLGNDTIIGGSGKDTLSGGGGNDSIDGGAGDDLLNGYGGSDSINGGIGADKITGGDGRDLLHGGDDG